MSKDIPTITLPDDDVDRVARQMFKDMGMYGMGTFMVTVKGLEAVDVRDMRVPDDHRSLAQTIRDLVVENPEIGFANLWQEIREPLERELGRPVAEYVYDFVNAERGEDDA